MTDFHHKAYQAGSALCVLLLVMMPMRAQANQPSQPRLSPRAEVHGRYGQPRSLAMTEVWTPLAQNRDTVLYADLRTMADSLRGREGNVGAGVRRVVRLGKLEGVAGAHAWFDRRQTARGTMFDQTTMGVEWLGDRIDVRANVYRPFTAARRYGVSSFSSTPFLGGTGIFVNGSGQEVEEAQGGYDLELGWRVPFVENWAGDTRVYGAMFDFDGPYTRGTTGWRARFSTDINSDFQIGGRVQNDSSRGAAATLEATLRFPFGLKRDRREHGLRARLDESPERDIDIVTRLDTTGGAIGTFAIRNRASGADQRVLHVNNTAGGGGNGSLENPFSTLAAAQAASQAHDIIYVHAGNGTSSGMNAGIVLDKAGQRLLGSGVDFTFDTTLFESVAPIPDGTLIAAATTAPVMTNGAGDGITVRANGVTVEGLRVQGATGSGIKVEADGTSATGVVIRDVRAQGNRYGVYIWGANGGAVGASVQDTVMSGNAEHGAVVYDDTAGAFAADLGGGALGSLGGNTLAGNGYEDLAVDLDGGTLMARGNWWGQAGGADTDNPAVGIRPQIYYGVPVNNGLSGHWTFDTEWMGATTAYDRSGLGRNGTLVGGMTQAGNGTVAATGSSREGLNFNGSTHGVNVGASTQYITAANAPFTVLISFKADVLAGTPTDGRLFNTKQSSTQTQFLMTAASSRIRQFTITGGQNPLNDSTIAAGNFYRGAFSHNNRVIRGYYNGLQDSNVITLGSDLAAASADHTFIGSFDPGVFPTTSFDGVIDDVRIYNRALSLSEIAELQRMDTSSSVDTGGFLTAAP